MQDAVFSLRVTSMGVKTAELAHTAKEIASVMDVVTTILRCVSLYYSGTWVNGHLYKPDFWSIPISKESPKWSQYIIGSLRISMSPSV